MIKLSRQSQPGKATASARRRLFRKVVGDRIVLASILFLLALQCR